MTTTLPGTTPENALAPYSADSWLRQTVGRLVRDAERVDEHTGAGMIRDRLAADGAKGACGHWELCVVAQWLRDRLGGGTVLVDGEYITWLPRYGAPAKLAAPSPLRVFLASFDRGMYPSLQITIAEARKAAQPA